MIVGAIKLHAQDLYMTATGQVQGKFNGEVIQKGHEKQMQLISYSYEISSPRDMATGASSGKRTRGFFTFSKLYDLGSMYFEKALISNEVLSNVTLEVYVPNTLGTAGGSGQETLALKIELTNASVASFKQWHIDDNQPTNKKRPVDEIKLVYSSIRITHVNGGIMVEDSWQSSR